MSYINQGRFGREGRLKLPRVRAGGRGEGKARGPPALTVTVVGDDGVGPGALLGLDVQHPVDGLLRLRQRLLGEAGQLRGVEPAHGGRPLPAGAPAAGGPGGPGRAGRGAGGAERSRTSGARAGAAGSTSHPRPAQPRPPRHVREAGPGTALKAPPQRGKSFGSEAGRGFKDGPVPGPAVGTDTFRSEV